MAKKKVCKNCKLFVEDDLCPICKKGAFTTNYQGRIVFLDVEKSRIAQETGVEEEGEYAIKTR